MSEYEIANPPLPSQALPNLEGASAHAPEGSGAVPMPVEKLPEPDLLKNLPEQVVSKKKWLDLYVAASIVPSAVDVGTDQILNYFEDKPQFWEHRIRFIETYVRIARYIKPEKTWNIAETGELSGTSAFLNSRGFKVDSVKGDFRYHIEAPSDSLDLLISMEVFEHIKDRDTNNFDDLVNFNFSGIDSFASEMSRVVKPSGFLALTTPNPCSLTCLLRLLEYKEPLFFWPHVKEYSPAEVIRRMEKAGFKSLCWDTMWCSFYLDPQPHHRRDLLKTMFTDRGFSAEHRGDVTFFAFQKLENADSKPATS